MLSCSDLYRISARLCAVFNIYHVPFGGIYMIFAGDLHNFHLPMVDQVSLCTVRMLEQSLTLCADEPRLPWQWQHPKLRESLGN